MKTVLCLAVTFEPLSVISTERAVTLVVLGKAEVVEGTGKTISSAHEIIEDPSVIRLLYMVKARRERAVPLSRRALFARDAQTCQYCGISGTPENKLEVEHVRPRSKGGQNVWENVVAACRSCNGFKADRTPEEAGMILRRKPFAPTRRAMIQTRGNGKWDQYLT